MGKGRSKKLAVEQYLEEVEWQNQRRSSPKGYYGKWFDPAWVGKKRSQSQQKYSSGWAITIGGILLFLVAVIWANGYSALPMMLFFAVPGIIIFLAARDGKKKK